MPPDPPSRRATRFNRVLEPPFLKFYRSATAAGPLFSLITPPWSYMLQKKTPQCISIATLSLFQTVRSCYSSVEAAASPFSFKWFTCGKSRPFCRKTPTSVKLNRNVNVRLRFDWVTHKPEKHTSLFIKYWVHWKSNLYLTSKHNVQYSS